MKNRNQINRYATILLALGFLALCPQVQAVVPAPDGGYQNFTTAEGTNALKNLTTGVGNTAVGWFSLFSNIDGSFNTGVGAGTLVLNIGNQNTGEGLDNTAVGTAALLLNTTGSTNTAVGATALLNNDTGFNNTATGANSLRSNTLGGNNTATGAGALTSNTEGNSNTAVGVGALVSNTMGGGNTAIGVLALSANQTGTSNTATGLAALQHNTGSNNTAAGAGALTFNAADNNTAYGSQALTNNTTGLENTAVGYQALFHNMDGNHNTAVGIGALGDNTGSNNTAIGQMALNNSTTGSINTALGAGAGIGVTTASNVICIGAAGHDVDNSCYIGNIWNQASPSGTTVFVDQDGKLGTTLSSRRFKDDIKPMAKTSEAILALQPVTFRYKKQFDPTGIAQFGLVAEDVEKVNPDLVVRDKEGKPYSVRYDQVNAMLLNEFLKEHRTVQELKSEIAALTATLKKQAAQIQKVSAKLDVHDSRSRTVLNEPQDDRRW